MTSPVDTSQPVVKVTAAKSVVAGIGATLTAFTTSLTVASLAVNDGQLDGGEIGGLVTAGLVLVSTVYGVWKVRNHPK